MDSTALIAAIQSEVPGAVLEPATTQDMHQTVYVASADVPAVARVLRDHQALRFALLAELTAVDYHPRAPRFELIYILVSIELRQRLRVKVRVSETGADPAHVRTVSDVWPAANWLEREVWDMFGIVFDGHPDPRRLLMPEDWEGFPLRKDYPVQIKMTPRTSEPLQVTEQQFRANLERDRLTRER
jgi:NADH-quinone oxidoreductase subunit C